MGQKVASNDINVRVLHNMINSNLSNFTDMAYTVKKVGGHSFRPENVSLIPTTTHIRTQSRDVGDLQNCVTALLENPTSLEHTFPYFQISLDSEEINSITQPFNCDKCHEFKGENNQCINSHILKVYMEHLIGCNIKLALVKLDSKLTYDNFNEFSLKDLGKGVKNENIFYCEACGKNFTNFTKIDILRHKKTHPS
ncbi:unnamed protein product [Gordionus sp. m RMFG-2023]